MGAWPETTAVLVLCRPDRVTDCDVAERTVLSEEERRRASRFAFPHLRKRFVCGRFMLRTVIGRLLSIEARRVPLVKSPWGRPNIAGESLAVSLSYSRDLVALAISRAEPLGIDVESAYREFDPAPIAALALRSVERDRLSGLATEDQRRPFLRLWVQKEAVTKAMGVGVGFPFARLDAEAAARALSGQLEHFTIGEEFLACLVVPGSTREIRTILWSGPRHWADVTTYGDVGSGRVWRVPLS